MNPVLYPILAAVALFIGLAIAGKGAQAAQRRGREKEFAELAGGTPYAPLRDKHEETTRVEAIIEHNEKLVKEQDPRTKPPFGSVSVETSDKLVPHPTIKCRFSVEPEKATTAGRYYHGIRPAIWRRDMRYPECANCMVEDQYL